MNITVKDVQDGLTSLRQLSVSRTAKRRAVFIPVLPHPAKVMPGKTRSPEERNHCCSTGTASGFYKSRIEAVTKENQTRLSPSSSASMLAAGETVPTRLGFPFFRLSFD